MFFVLKTIGGKKWLPMIRNESINNMYITGYDFEIECDFLEKIDLKTYCINSRYFVLKIQYLIRFFISFNKFCAIMTQVWLDHLWCTFLVQISLNSIRDRHGSWFLYLLKRSAIVPPLFVEVIPWIQIMVLMFIQQ